MAEEPFEQEFAEALKVWREKHHLREDDPVMLLTELFRIHQSHWDELRRLKPPGLEDLQGIADQMTSVLSTAQAQGLEILQQLAELKGSQQPPGVRHWVAITAVALGAAGGFALGLAWP